MRVIAFGNKMMIRRLTTSLARGGIEVVSLSEVSEAVALLKQERFDLVIVDGLMEEAGLVCHCISELRYIPVVLMIREAQADWRKLQSLDADGFIPDWAGQAELAARLRSIARRWLLGRGIEKDSPAVFQNYEQNIIQSQQSHLEGKTDNGMQNDKEK